MPNKGIWQQTKNMNRVIAVHNTFSLNWICKGRYQQQRNKFGYYTVCKYMRFLKIYIILIIIYNFSFLSHTVFSKFGVCWKFKIFTLANPKILWNIYNSNFHFHVLCILHKYLRFTLQKIITNTITNCSSVCEWYVKKLTSHMLSTQNIA